MKKTSLYSFLVITFILLSSCEAWRFNKLTKSSDYDKKYAKAGEYFKKENYVKALQLYEELIPIYKGTDKAEEIYYYYTYCNFYQGDYGLSQYHFKNYTRQFPSGNHVEECWFMNAYCYYLSSPYYTLDQTDTKNAIKEFQSFIDNFPESNRIDSCNKLVDKLRQKLENKDYDLFKQYYKLSDYKAAITSCKNFMKDFPDSKYVEESYYVMIDSYYLLAINSISSKKEERLNGAIENYLKFVDLYPQSKYLSKAESIYTSSKQAKKSLIK